MGFFKGVSPWFLSKLGNFFRFCFLEKISQKNVFYEILERRNAFLDYKNKKFKKSKNWDFSKGLVHGFSQNLVIILDFDVRENKPKKCVLRNSRKKKRLSRL